MSNLKDNMSPQERADAEKVRKMNLRRVSRSRTGKPAVYVLEKALKSYERAIIGSKNSYELRIMDAVDTINDLIWEMTNEYEKNSQLDSLTEDK